ncbi:AmmeMemoRadiSam system protein B [Candidatus Thiosymbion oneisti]|uniref:AmmeMemoRadiSam system protein B n=1 Tax=Candidatus Thiosymbion oneisti TaxID=589554 RepID=UPI000AD3C009|nr:AmmeMemoRadiSam system protein B [Candidatus Thiosymbion oneisti]
MTNTRETMAREAMVAGMFYPADAQELRRAVRSFLAAAGTVGTKIAGTEKDKTETPKALIVPHAGYIYSGPVAGSAYAQLAAHAGELSRIVLLGPSHRVPFTGLAYSAAETFLTPLGSVPVDREAFAKVRDLPQVRCYEAPFEGEHCLEVQLPFLQLSLQAFRIVPFLVGAAATEATGTEEVAQVIARLWGGEETLIVVSSDLSHYLDYAHAVATDAETTRAIEALRPEAITPTQACGHLPLGGLLREAKRHGLKAQTLDLRNSGDTAGPRDQVVGYGAYAFS